MDNTGQASYDAVYAASRELHAAAVEYVKARYQNYRVRLVSPDGAFRNATDDLAKLAEDLASEASNVAWRDLHELA